MSFGSKNKADFVTRSEAEGALTAYVTKEDAATLVNEVSELTARVAALEGLARELRHSNPSAFTTNPTARREAVQGNIVNKTQETESTARGTVDYGAIAFGLSEIKREVSQHLDSAAVARKHVGVVQYFADVLAKSDPSFDEVLFKRQSGV